MACAFRYLLDALNMIIVALRNGTLGVPERATVYTAEPSPLDMLLVVALATVVPLLVAFGLLELEARYRKRVAEARIREAEARTREADADLARSRACLVGGLTTRVMEAERYTPSDAVVIALISQGSPAVSELHEAPIVALPPIGSNR